MRSQKKKFFRVKAGNFVQIMKWQKKDNEVAKACTLTLANKYVDEECAQSSTKLL